MATFLGYSNFSGKYGDKFSADLLYDILEKNIEGNYYRIRLYGYIRSWGYRASGTYATFYINGENSGGFSSIDTNQYSEVARRDVIVYGDQEGKCVLNWSLFVDTQWTIGDASASGSLTLETIPRTSSVTCTDGFIESAVSININRASEGFVHTLRYTFGGISDTIATGVATSYGWTIPATFYTQIPNSKSGVGTIYCDTYSSGNLIGTSSYNFNVYTDESKCKPDVVATVIDNNSSTVSLTGDNNKLIKFMSDAKVTINATSKNNASISSINVLCGDGKSGSGEEVTLSKVESGSFTISVTDSRGYITSVTDTKTLINYVVLTINPTFYRVEPTTGEVNISYDGNYYAGSFGTTDNSLTVKYRYKESTTSSWDGVEYTQITPTIDEEDNKYSDDVSLGTGFDYQKSYDFEIVVADKLNTILQTAFVSEGIPMFAMFKNHLEAFGNKLIDNDGSLFLPEVANIYSGDDNIIHHNSTSKETHVSSNGGNIYFRPNGVGSADGQIYVTPDGSMNISENLSVNNNVYASQFRSHSGNISIMSSNINIATIIDSGTRYLELQTANIGGYTAFGIDIWTSDKRLKKSIVDTNVKALDIINKIKHREFKYKHNDELVKIGYVADELGEIDENLIFRVGKDELKQPKESIIIPILSKAIQEQQEIIKKLELRISELEKKVNTN